MTDGAGGTSSTTDDIEVTHQARNQWDVVVDSPVQPENAWRAAEPVAHPTAPRESARYARYYEPEGVVLLVIHGRLVTLFSVDRNSIPIRSSRSRRGGDR